MAMLPKSVSDTIGARGGRSEGGGGKTTIATKAITTHKVTVSGRDHGEVFRNPRSGKLEWFKVGRGKQQFTKATTLDDVPHIIARLSRCDPTEVVLKRLKED